MFSGQPWPALDEVDGVQLVKVPSLDLYREPDPFRFPNVREICSWADLIELATMLTGGFPEPLTFSLRVRDLLTTRRADYDIVHDNQSFGSGLLGLMADGWPIIGTCHHPVTVDRLVDLGQAPTRLRELSLRRWYGFVRMQDRVARRMPRILTVSSSSRRDIVEQMGVAPERVAVVPIGAVSYTHLDVYKRQAQLFAYGLVWIVKFLVFNRIIFADRTSGAEGNVGAKANVGAEGAGQPASNGGTGSLSGSRSVGAAGGNGGRIGHAQTGQDDSTAGERLVPEPRY